MGYRVDRPESAFSLDRPQKRRERVKNDPKHLRFIRTLDCLCCSSKKNVEAAHIRYRAPEHKKAGTAMAQKPDDRWTVPLCMFCHRIGLNSQHNSNERDWWGAQGIDPVAVSIALHEISGDHDGATKIIAEARQCNATGEKR